MRFKLRTGKAFEIGPCPSASPAALIGHTGWRSQSCRGFEHPAGCDGGLVRGRHRHPGTQPRSSGECSGLTDGVPDGLGSTSQRRQEHEPGGVQDRLPGSGDRPDDRVCDAASGQGAQGHRHGEEAGQGAHVRATPPGPASGGPPGPPEGSPEPPGPPKIVNEGDSAHRQEQQDVDQVPPEGVVDVRREERSRGYNTKRSRPSTTGFGPCPGTAPTGAGVRAGDGCKRRRLGSYGVPPVTDGPQGTGDPRGGSEVDTGRAADAHHGPGGPRTGSCTRKQPSSCPARDPGKEGLAASTLHSDSTPTVWAWRDGSSNRPTFSKAARKQDVLPRKSGDLLSAKHIAGESTTSALDLPPL